MKTVKRLIAVLLAVMMVLSLAACGKEKEPEKEPEKNTKFGGILKMVTVVDVNQAGFPISTGTDQNVVANTALERLGNFNEKGFIEGFLAKEIITKPEVPALVLKLQEGIKFHDGTPFNAQAVVDVWNILFDNGYKTHFTNVVRKDAKAEDTFANLEIAATGEYEVTVNLIQWRADAVEKFCINCGQMFSPSYFKANGATDAERLEFLYTHLCGTGPFIQEEFVIGEKITFKKNPDYWQKDAEGNQLPYLDGIEWIVCPDQTAAVNILKTGDASMILYPSMDNYKTLLDQGFTRYGVDSCSNIAGDLGMFFASGKEGQSVSNLKVRQAVCYAIDNDALCKAFTNGLGVVTNQLGVPGTKEYNANVKGYPYDVEKAKALLKEAGYAEGTCEVTLSFSPQFEDVFVAVQNMLQKAGFKVVLDICSTMGDKIVVGGKDPYVSISWWSAPTGISAWYRYFSANPTTMVGDALDLQAAGVWDCYDRCMTAKSDDEQKKAMDELAVLCVDELCLYCPFYATLSYFIGDDTIQDSQFGICANTQWTPAVTWIKK